MRGLTMQFHLNGFKTGNPGINAVSARAANAQGAQRALPDVVDVLIVGSGPTGLLLAAQLAAFPDITTCIIEEREGPLLVGQADGIACRTMEMFNGFGISDRIIREAYQVNEVTFWKPDLEQRDRIMRMGRVQDVEDGLSEMPHVILNQARIHDFLLDVMAAGPSSIIPDYARKLVELTIDESGDLMQHPVTATFSRRSGDQQVTETVRARFVVGCDGARSTVRRLLCRELSGDAANQAWGVMDVLAVTDFPDIRRKSTVHSAEEGSILIIPREGGYMVRLYIELEKLAPSERVASRNITLDRLISAAQRILSPYTLDVKEVAWWSVYEIGQRICDKFDDVPQEEVTHRLPRAFIAGDACHTHSPKAGQGMNVSMQDAFNLGWKLASVLTGRMDPKILHSYSSERKAIAQELIDFDRELARMFSAKPKDPDNPASEGVDPAEFQRYFIKQGRFAAGTATRYAASVLTAAGDHQYLCPGFTIGMRFHSAPVVRFADAKPMHLGHCALADGRWRIYAFAGADHLGPTSAMRGLCDFLESSPVSPLNRYARPGEDSDALFDIRAIFQQTHEAFNPSPVPAVIQPAKGRYGLIDYEKIFCVDPRPNEDIYDLRQIDRTAGCMVVVRPDQYIAHVLPLSAREELSDFFAGFMRP